MSLRLKSAVLTVLLMFTLTGCSSLMNPLSPVASGELEQSKEDVTYYNGYFGITVNVPQDWYVYSIDETNLTAAPEGSAALDALSRTEYEDGGSVLMFIELWNRNDSADLEHASFMLYIEEYDGVGEAEYVAALTEAYGGDFDGYYSTLTQSDTKTMDGIAYNHIVYSTSVPDSDKTYTEEYFVRELESGKFIVACTTYWDGNDVSCGDAAYIVDNAFELN